MEGPREAVTQTCGGWGPFVWWLWCWRRVPEGPALPGWRWRLGEEGNMKKPLWESQVSAIRIQLPLQAWWHAAGMMPSECPGTGGPVGWLSLLCVVQEEDIVRYHVVLEEKLLKNDLHHGMHRATMLGFSFLLGFFLHDDQVRSFLWKPSNERPGPSSAITSVLHNLHQHFLSLIHSRQLSVFHHKVTTGPDWEAPPCSLSVDISVPWLVMGLNPGNHRALQFCFLITDSPQATSKVAGNLAAKRNPPEVAWPQGVRSHLKCEGRIQQQMNGQYYHCCPCRLQTWGQLPPPQYPSINLTQPLST